MVYWYYNRFFPCNNQWTQKRCATQALVYVRTRNTERRCFDRKRAFPWCVVSIIKKQFNVWLIFFRFFSVYFFKKKTGLVRRLPLSTRKKKLIGNNNSCIVEQNNEKSAIWSRLSRSSTTLSIVQSKMGQKKRLKSYATLAARETSSRFTRLAKWSLWPTTTSHHRKLRKKRKSKFSNSIKWVFFCLDQYLKNIFLKKTIILF